MDERLAGETGGPSRHRRALAATAAAYALLHHLGLLPGLGGAPRGTRWNDWADLLVPWVVLACAAATLVAAPAGRRAWTAFGAGAVAYASGHGIHLAANSVANAAPSPTAQLWDEVVGHAVWYAGVALVAAALAHTMVGRPRPGAPGLLLGVAVGATWGSNAAGAHGGWMLGLLGGLAAAAYGWRGRADLRLTLLVAGLASLATLGIARLG